MHTSRHLAATSILLLAQDYLSTASKALKKLWKFLLKEAEFSNIYDQGGSGSYNGLQWHQMFISATKFLMVISLTFPDPAFMGGVW